MFLLVGLYVGVYGGTQYQKLNQKVPPVTEVTFVRSPIHMYTYLVIFTLIIFNQITTNGERVKHNYKQNMIKKKRDSISTEYGSSKIVTQQNLFSRTIFIHHTPSKISFTDVLSLLKILRSAGDPHIYIYMDAYINIYIHLYIYLNIEKSKYRNI